MVQATGHDSYGLTTLMVWSPVPFSVEQLVAGRRPPRITGSSSRRESSHPIHDFNSAAVEQPAACVGWCVQLVLTRSPQCCLLRVRGAMSDLFSMILFFDFAAGHIIQF